VQKLMTYYSGIFMYKRGMGVCLTPCVFAPDVEHKNCSDEY